MAAQPLPGRAAERQKQQRAASAAGGTASCSLHAVVGAGLQLLPEAFLERRNYIEVRSGESHPHRQKSTTRLRLRLQVCTGFCFDEREKERTGAVFALHCVEDFLMISHMRLPAGTNKPLLAAGCWLSASSLSVSLSSSRGSLFVHID